MIHNGVGCSKLDLGVIGRRLEGLTSFQFRVEFVQVPGSKMRQ